MTCAAEKGVEVGTTGINAGIIIPRVIEITEANGKVRAEDVYPTSGKQPTPKVLFEEVPIQPAAPEAELCCGAPGAYCCDGSTRCPCRQGPYRFGSGESYPPEGCTAELPYIEKVPHWGNPSSGVQLRADYFHCEGLSFAGGTKELLLWNSRWWVRPHMGVGVSCGPDSPWGECGEGAG